MSHQLVLTAKPIDAPSRPVAGSREENRRAGAAATPRDRALFTSLVRAYKAHSVTIVVRASRLNQPGSPLWDPIGNIAPLLCILGVAILSFAVVNVLVGTTAMVVGVLIYMFGIRPIILRIVQDRAIESAVGHVHNWDLLWKQGGLVLKPVNGTACASPAGDWRTFVLHHIPIVAIDGTNGTDAFRARASRRRSGTGEVEF